MDHIWQTYRVWMPLPWLINNVTGFVVLIYFAKDKQMINSRALENTSTDIDVWRGVWRCTHAKLAPLTPHPLARDRHCGPVSGQRGERFGTGNLSAPISPLLFKCADGATTLSLRFGIDQDFGISGLDGELAAGCLQSGPAWVVFCFRCWVADGKNGADGEVRHWVLGGGGYGRPLPLPHYLHLAAHCQSDKSGHLVPSFCAFQHNRDQTVPIFSRAVIAFSRYSRNVGHSNRVYQASSSRPLVSQLEHSGYPQASCGIGRRWTPCGQTSLVLGSSSARGLSPTTRRGCVLTDGSTLL